jgi:hypothetical protein
MGHFSVATTYVQRRARKFVDAESVKPDASSNDVDDRVDGAHFMEMDLFERDVVNAGFGLP